MPKKIHAGNDNKNPNLLKMYNNAKGGVKISVVSNLERI